MSNPDVLLVTVLCTEMVCWFQDNMADLNHDTILERLGELFTSNQSEHAFQLIKESWESAMTDYIEVTLGPERANAIRGFVSNSCLAFHGFKWTVGGADMPSRRC